MEKVIIGKKETNKKYDFRETCFGIVVKNDKLYCTKRNGDISLIGGGIEPGETHEQCLKREFLEETGCSVNKIKELCTIDCFWLTRDNKNMESLTNIYIVEINEKIIEPTENGNELEIIDFEKASEMLKLPYQKEAIRQYKKKML